MPEEGGGLTVDDAENAAGVRGARLSFTSVAIPATGAAEDAQNASRRASSGPGVHLRLEVANELALPGEHLAVSLQLATLADFAPEAIIRQVPPLARMAELRHALAVLRQTLVQRPALERRVIALVDDVLVGEARVIDEHAAAALLDALADGDQARLEPLLAEIVPAPGPTDERRLRQALTVLIAHLVAECSASGGHVATSAQAEVDGLLAGIDRALSAQLRQITGDRRLQESERAWRAWAREAQVFPDVSWQVETQRPAGGAGAAGP